MTLLSATYAAFANELTIDRVPSTVLERARHLILDAVGTGIAAIGAPWANRAFAAAEELGQGTAPVLGHGRALAPRDAAMLNGILMHGLDYDDTHAGGIIHATVSAFPTALVAADRADASGADLLLAYIAAMEVSTRVASVSGGAFHGFGFHPTGLIGAFGSTVAAARLLGLDPSQSAMAQGIVLSMAGGSLEFLEDGAWTKRLHPGWAASSAITAATLARHGYVGPTAAYEGRFGLYALYLRDAAPEHIARATAGLGDVWEIDNVAVKPLPACHMTHAAIDAAIWLRQEHGLRGADIAEVTVLVPEAVIPIVCEPAAPKRTPATGYDAQFSIPYTVATALLTGSFTLDALDPAALRDPAVRDLAGRVAYAIDPDTDYPTHFTGEVIVQTRDGRTLRRREGVNRGAADRPLSNADISRKFVENATRTIDAPRAEAIRAAILAIDQNPARTLADVLAHRP
ncbi:MmgE/PrpD family protein [Sphingomonas sp. TREG-RG-20F-R18-01]|uniref:MmgE/PrpD family protein n=1 Tax=Sphingomonas sp. TREG-RG-20F-R18-01 TaxID=2914982 RepID=UPI001F5A35CA|nr:MmgE/PrpD family protein [Sphingomonas sp. TREG-RG-20F-R18-01]